MNLPTVCEDGILSDIQSVDQIIERRLKRHIKPNIVLFKVVSISVGKLLPNLTSKAARQSFPLSPIFRAFN
jgi:hypothetical protein